MRDHLGVSEAEFNDFQKAYISKCEEKKEEILFEYAKLYDKHYTEEDIEQQILIYSSPVGQKMVEKQPQINRENIVIAAIYSQEIVKEIIAEFNAAAEKKYKEDLLKRGH